MRSNICRQKFRFSKFIIMSKPENNQLFVNVGVFLHYQFQIKVGWLVSSNLGRDLLTKMEVNFDFDVLL